ncbi:TIGR02647 family protein [Stutzerimonas tarimensis]|uniref:TIGR02647 family protein n=1 Tax=Stutzerimonas tarimensis TaxID=1507735 RepID=A0ABV7T2E1_9GAMM
MPYSPDLVSEIDVLALFDLDNHLSGVKIRHDARPDAIAAARRLHQKGLVTQPDGGYLTDLGRDAAEHVQGLMLILTQPEQVN